MANFIKSFVSFNQNVSRWLNKLLPESVCQDGNSFFRTRILPGLLQNGAVIYDLVGGKQPFVTSEIKTRWSLKVVGLDLSADELKSAPPGVYDTTIVADLCEFKGNSDADIVICQATLEHVHDTRGAICSITSILKIGGIAYIFFAPSRNAVFARLNLVLPQRTKEKILFLLLPETEGSQGFPAYYDQCTPSELEALFREFNLRVVERKLFYMSTYFMVFSPLFVVWRLWQGIFYLIAGANAAKTFIYVVQREEQGNQNKCGSI
jgi:2-polyprenyl-6-hydroxyphenyl methylase/3-demethylubiquinone-9 3-methyltransferase